MLATLTLPGTFFFYAGVAFIGAIILYFVLPETEGRSLTEIEEHFSGGLSLNPKRGQLADEEKRSNTVVPPIRPKTDVVVGIGATDKTVTHTGKDKNKNQKIHVELKSRDNNDLVLQRHLGETYDKLHNQSHHQHHHHHLHQPLYAQNPRAYMRHNNRTKSGDDNDAVFSTHL